MAIHGDAFLQNIKDMLKTITRHGAQPVQFQVSPDIIRTYHKEIRSVMKPPIFPGAPPSFFGLPLVQKADLPRGTVFLLTNQPGGGRQEIDLSVN